MELLKTFRGRATILGHQNADLDCLCSSIALKEGLKEVNPALVVEIGAAGGFSKAAKRILEEFNYEASVNPALEEGLLIILDTSSLELLSPLDNEVRGFQGEIIVIDHHVPNQLSSLAHHSIVDPDATSTSELVYDLLKSLGVEIREITAISLLIGILADTQHLRFASPKVLRTASELLSKAEVDYEGVLSLIDSSEELSERMAHLKAAQRMKIRRVNDYLLATSRVSSFSASTASALVALGADCAFVGAQRKGEIQISARASRNFLVSTKLHLGMDVMSRIGPLIGGSGGGHRGAAGAKGRGDVDAALEKCISLVQDFLLSNQKNKT
jgi:nanoRNase/pAp phosphatase (c-di-AMP/oligoRNAs hydrolase)